jgi:hypothetical protein
MSTLCIIEADTGAFTHGYVGSCGLPAPARGERAEAASPAPGG